MATGQLNYLIDCVSKARDNCLSETAHADSTRVMQLCHALEQFSELGEKYRRDAQRVHQLLENAASAVSDQKVASALRNAQTRVQNMAEYVEQMTQLVDEPRELLIAVPDARQQTAQLPGSLSFDVAHQQADYVLTHTTALRNVAAQAVITAGDLDQVLDAETGIPQAIGGLVYQLNATVQDLQNAHDTITQCQRRGDALSAQQYLQLMAMTVAATVSQGLDAVVVKVEEATAQAGLDDIAALSNPNVLPVADTAAADLRAMMRSGEELVAMLDSMAGMSRTLDLTERLNAALAAFSR